jgi:uncharacterized protein (DUF1778 family)
MKTSESARLELRLTKQKKIFFEEIAMIGGFKSLSEFIIHTVDEQAKVIIEEHKKILTTQKDNRIFFDALMNPPKPNQALKKAFKKYNEALLVK